MEVVKQGLSVPQHSADPALGSLHQEEALAAPPRHSVVALALPPRLARPRLLVASVRLRATPCLVLPNPRGRHCLEVEQVPLQQHPNQQGVAYSVVAVLLLLAVLAAHRELVPVLAAVDLCLAVTTNSKTSRCLVAQGLREALDSVASASSSKLLQPAHLEALQPPPLHLVVGSNRREPVPLAALASKTRTKLKTRGCSVVVEVSERALLSNNRRRVVASLAVPVAAQRGHLSLDKTTSKISSRTPVAHSLEVPLSNLQEGVSLVVEHSSSNNRSQAAFLGDPQQAQVPALVHLVDLAVLKTSLPELVAYSAARVPRTNNNRSQVVCSAAPGPALAALSLVARARQVRARALRCSATLRPSSLRLEA